MVVVAGDGRAVGDGLAVAQVGNLGKRHLVGVAGEVGGLVVVDLEQGHRVNVVLAEAVGVFEAELPGHELRGVGAVGHVDLVGHAVVGVVNKRVGAEAVAVHRHHVGLVWGIDVLALRAEVVVGPGHLCGESLEPWRVVLQRGVGVDLEGVGAAVARLVDGGQRTVAHAAVVGYGAGVEAVVFLRQEGVHHDGLVADGKVAHLARALAAVVGAAGVERRLVVARHGAHGADGELPALAELGVDVGAYVVALVGEMVDVTALAHVAGADEEAGAVVAALDFDVVLGVVTCAEDLTDVVDVVPSVGGVAVEHQLHHLAGEDGLVLGAVGDGGAGELVHEVGHVVVVGILGTIHVGGKVGVDRDTVLSFVGDLGLSALAFLGGDDDHAADGIEAVYGRCGTVLQYGNRLDVVGVDVVHRALYAVDDDERCILRAAHAERGEVGARLTGGLHRSEAGDTSAEHRGDVGRWRFHQFVTLEGGHRASEALFLHLSVTHDNHVVERG